VCFLVRVCLSEKFRFDIVVAHVVVVVRPVVPMVMLVGSPERWPGSVLPRCILRGLVRQCGPPAVASLVVAGVVAMVLSSP
jgi:hypothetical protein